MSYTRTQPAEVIPQRVELPDFSSYYRPEYVVDISVSIDEQLYAFPPTHRPPLQRTTPNLHGAVTFQMDSLVGRISPFTSLFILDFGHTSKGSRVDPGSDLTVWTMGNERVQVPTVGAS